MHEIEATYSHMYDVDMVVVFMVNGGYLYSGRYKVFVKGDQDPAPRAVGGYEGAGSFGELALLYNQPRAATVQAETEGSLWAMDRITFRRIILKNAFKKRQMYENLIDSVPMLKELEVCFLYLSG